MNRFSLILLTASLPASETVVASYDSGVAASAGVSGAVDPAGQGWTLSNASSNQYSDGYDSGDGGWRTVDGTTAGPANYSQTIGGAGLTAMTTDNLWTMEWTVSLDKDALGSSGGSVTNYYLGRTDDNLVALVDLAADGLGYFLTLQINGSNQFVIEDTSGGSGTYNTGLDVTTSPNFGTFSLTHDRTAGTATLDYGAGTATLSPGTPLVGGRNAVFFGAGSSGGQGSALWNEFSIETVPEPAITLLGGLGMLSLLRRRR